MIRRPITLRGRLVAVAAGSILAAVAVFALAAVLLVGHELHSTLDVALRQRAVAVAELAVSAPAVLTEPGALEGVGGPGSGRQIAIEVIDAQGRLLARSPTLGARLLPLDRLVHVALRAGRAGYEDVRLGGHPYRLYAAPIAQAGGPAAGGAVLAASDTTDIGDTAHRLGVVLALTGVGAALLAAIVATALTRRGLAPLRRLALAAGEIERTADLSRRLPEPAATDEVGQLTGVLNRMLASLQQASASERCFLADASHELRTPVTALLGNVEYAGRHGLDTELLADLRRDATRLARLVDDLLVLERAGSTIGETRLESVALDEWARQFAASRDGAVALAAAAPAWARVDPDALTRAAGNLVENALIHGPPGGVVTIAVRRDAGHACLTVRDDGPGPDPADLPHVFERFWRGAAASERPGSGLGLAIAAAIAQRLGGRITVVGSAFTIELPLDDPPPDR